MADETTKDAQGPPGIREFSENAFSRLLAIHDEEMHAARMIASSDCYSDLFCEGHCDPVEPAFHEAMVEPGASVAQLDRRKLSRRMSFVEKVREDRLAQFRAGLISGPLSAVIAYTDHFADSIPDGAWTQGFWETGPSWVEGPV